MNVVLDANVYLSALFSPHGVCAKILRKLANSLHWKLVMSDAIYAEVSNCLKRPKTSKATNLSESTLCGWFDSIRAMALNIDEPEHILGICRDPKDEMYLSVAIASRSSYLVTGDKDLLVLKAVEQTQIIAPAQFLIILEN